jgi:hypothetical protein
MKLWSSGDGSDRRQFRLGAAPHRRNPQPQHL